PGPMHLPSRRQALQWVDRGRNVRGQGGRGLGLALVKSLVTAMGDRVSAAPRLDGSPGTEFLVQLPACPAPI
ncbi:MAG: ATP-binding protein, partial [Prochlorococcaceae cyanobacterium]